MTPTVDHGPKWANPAAGWKAPQYLKGSKSLIHLHRAACVPEKDLHL